MGFYLDATSITLNDLRERIEHMDLVPSRVSLLDEIHQKLEILKQHGILTLVHS